MKRYYSKIGLEIIIPILLILVSTSVVMVASGAWPGIIINLVVLGFTVYLFSNTYYTIDGHILKVQAGFFRFGDIDIHAIQEVKKTNSILSAPAASLNRIAIHYNNRSTIVISPKDKEAFTQHLKDINPSIQVII